MAPEAAPTNYLLNLLDQIAAGVDVTGRAAREVREDWAYSITEYQIVR